MSHYPLLTRMSPLTTIQRERILPVEGQVLVQMGARVEPMSIVARAEIPQQYHIINVAQALKVSPDAAEKYIRPRPGNRVKAGQAVAGRRTALGLFPRIVRTPHTGTVAAVGGGRILLESTSESIELRAYLPGTVSNVIPQRGVLVEATGALIQCVWGSGGESFGVLKVLVEQPNQPLDAKKIDVSSHGAVLVGGSTIDQDALQQALELQVRGIIIGSLDPSLLEMTRQMPFPVVATEGLGKAPMALPIFELLRTNEGREAALNGNRRLRWEGIRPEIVIPLPTKGLPPPAVPPVSLKVGARVRVVRGPMFGEVGTIRNIPGQPILLETGARVSGAVVAFEKSGLQHVPTFNLELLG